MKMTDSSPGYILLLSILVVGTIASAVVVSLVLLGTGAMRTALSIQQSADAIALSEGCSEYALMKLRADPLYVGNEIVTQFQNGGRCKVFAIGGAGNNNRILCTEAEVGTVTRRMEIIIQQLLPKTLIYSWQEVPFLTLCQ